MRKFTLLIAGCLLASTTFAGNPGYRQDTRFHKLTERRTLTHAEKPVNAISELTEHKAVVKKMAKVASTEAPTVITDAPEGVTKVYKKACAGYSPYYFWIMEYEEESLAAEIVFTSDNEVYFKDIISNAVADTYVKGTLAEGTITVPMGQCIFFSEEQGYGYKLVAMTEDIENSTFLTDDSKESVKFTIAEDGVISMEEGALLGLAYTDDNSWGGYVDFYQTYTEFNVSPVTKPESLATEKWALTTSEGDGHFLKVGIDGSDLYIGGLSESMPDAWVKGSISGSDVTIDTKQYMGIYGGMFQYFMTCESFTDPENGTGYRLVNTPATFSYDAAAKTLTQTSDNILLVNAAEDRVYYLDMFKDALIAYQDAYKPATPLNPHSLYTDGFNPGYGNGLFSFMLPKVGTDRSLLNTDAYYYNIYVDGWRFTFYPDEYEGLADMEIDELTNVPYNFTDHFDISVSGAEHQIYYYFEGFETLGVQGVYTIDGVTNRTDLVNYNVETGEETTINAASIDSVDAERKAVSVTYYDLTGREHANPSSGLVIKRTVYSDGTVRSVKSMIKQ